MQRAILRAMTTPHLEYCFDIVCPYAYLGSTQIETLVQKHDATMSWSPVLLGGILKGIGTDPFFTTKLPAAKMRHNLTDMLRWAEHFEVPFAIHSRHPLRTVTVMRSLLVAGIEPTLIHALYRAYWVDNRDVDNEDVLAEVLSEAGYEGQAIVRETQNPTIKQALIDRTQEAIDRGVFGVPAMFVGDEMVWGQDRLHFVETLLRGETL
jgi:2-hydroxychromene-2-carboxylate isomerase